MALPVPRALLDQHIAVLGKTRSGKSSALRLLVEDLLGRDLPVCIVDPKGDWWGIKLGQDGRSAGYPVVIFGGPHADVPITEHAGATIAELWATGNRSCLIDLGGWMVAERTRFWIAFASTLFKHTRGDRWLVVDEIHNFAPKGSVKGLEGKASVALHWTNRLASEGLGKGIRMPFASQRPQKVHNDTLTSAETLVAMRVIHPSDRGAIAEWVKGAGDQDGAEVLNSLADMARGEGWVWSPEHRFGPKRVQFPMFATYDSFRPQTSADTKRLKGWAAVDLEDVKAKLGKVVEEATANDPALLRQQLRQTQAALREAEGQLVTLRARPPAAGKEKRVEVPIVTDKQAAALHRAADTLSAAAERAASSAQGIRDALAAATQAIETTGALHASRLREGRAPAVGDSPTLRAGAARVSAATDRRDAAAAHRGNAHMGRRESAAGAGDGSLSKMARAFLTALAQAGKPLTKKQLRARTGYAASGPVSDTFALLTRERLVAPDGSGLALTGGGLDRLGPYDPLPTGQALRSGILNGTIRDLSKMERAFLEHLFEAWPNAVSKAELRERAGYAASGPVSDAFAHIVAIDYATKVGAGQLKAADELFEEA